MAVISVEVPDMIAKRFKPFTIIKYETLISNNNSEIDFDFKSENINQNDFLSYLEQKHG